MYIEELVLVSPDCYMYILMLTYCDCTPDSEAITRDDYELSLYQSLFWHHTQK